MGKIQRNNNPASYRHISRDAMLKMEIFLSSGRWCLSMSNGLVRLSPFPCCAGNCLMINNNCVLLFRSKFSMNVELKYVHLIGTNEGAPWLLQTCAVDWYSSRCLVIVTNTCTWLVSLKVPGDYYKYMNLIGTPQGAGDCCKYGKNTTFLK